MEAVDCKLCDGHIIERKDDNDNVVYVCDKCGVVHE